jgi:hypothetical protein
MAGQIDQDVNVERLQPRGQRCIVQPVQLMKFVAMAAYALRGIVVCALQVQRNHLELPAVQLGQQSFQKIHHRMGIEIG